MAEKDAAGDSAAKTEATTAPSSNDKGASAVASLQKIVADLQAYLTGGGPAKTANKLKEAVVAEVNKTTPTEWIIAGAISFFLALLYSLITKSKEDSAINFGMILYAVLMTGVAVVVRVKSIENQYAWSVVILSVVGLLFGWKSAPLFLGGVPPLVNYLRQELKKGH